jgi:hypothetical protein
MPKRFLQTEYEKLTKAELIKAIYTIGDKHDKLTMANQINCHQLREARFKLRQYKLRNAKLNQSIRTMRQRVVELTPSSHSVEKISSEQALEYVIDSLGRAINNPQTNAL